MPGLLLQKVSLNSKSKGNFETVKQRLSLWKDGQLDQLIFQGKTIQDRLQGLINKKPKQRPVFLLNLLRKEKSIKQ